MMFDRIRIEIHAFHGGPCPPVIICADRVVQQKFGPSLRSVNFDRHHGRRPDQDSILAFLCDYEGALLDSEAAPKFSRKHHGATPPDFAGQCSHNDRIADNLNIGQTLRWEHSQTGRALPS